MSHTTLQPLQAQSALAIARDLESFDESRNARSINVGDPGQIDDDSFRRLPSQHGQEQIAKAWRGIDAEASMQAHEPALLAVIHGDLKTVGRSDYAARQPNSPSGVRCHLALLTTG